ncbi:MAG: tetratricopeptide repeat protein [Gemmatimonadales bacterium]
MRFTGAVLAIVALLGGAPCPTVAAQFRNPPTRPRLAAGADTNDARAYYGAGVAFLKRDPWAAATAFYWASRLEPSWPEAYYARRVAGLLAQERLLIGYIQGARSVINSKEAQQLDSLEYQAQRLNPFFLRDLDGRLLAGYIVAVYKQQLRRAGERPLDPTDESDLEFLVNQYLRSGASLPVRAALAASRRSFDEALDLYRQLLSQSREKAQIRTERARIFFAIGSYDSALVEMQQALSELRQRDTVRLMPVYVSRELFEHSIGMIHEAAGDTAAAREAYGRALVEDLTYAPAHVRLAILSLLKGDTATALAEWDLAVQVAPAEAPPRAAYALLLAQTGSLDDAVLHLHRAADLEPFYATPHYLLGYVAELQGKREEALEGYRGFLTRVSARDRLRTVVEQRVVDLGP